MDEPSVKALRAAIRIIHGVDSQETTAPTAKEAEMTAKEVAKWMTAEFERDGALKHETAAREIDQRFGSKFVYVNDNGNLSIDRTVLREFRELIRDSAIWIWNKRSWLRREPLAAKGKRQMPARRRTG